MIAAATDGFVQNYDAIMNGEMKTDLFAGHEAEAMMDNLGSIAFDYAFNTKPILKLEIAADNILRYLLGELVRGAVYYDTEHAQEEVPEKFMAIISENYKGIYHFYAKDKTKEEKLYLRLLLVTDYICGMTDSYAKRLYQELKAII
jgi:dGTPase